MHSLSVTFFQRTRVANGPGDLRSISARVILKPQKMVLDISLLNTQHYKVCIKSKVEQSREMDGVLPYTPGVVAIEKEAFWSSSTTVANLKKWFQVFLSNANHSI